MLLGKAALIGILIIAISSATTGSGPLGERPGEDGATTTPGPELPATRATLDRDRAAETTPTPPRQTQNATTPARTTRPSFRGYAKFVNNAATTNQGYDYKPVSLSSRQPSLRPMTLDEATPRLKQRKASGHKAGSLRGQSAFLEAEPTPSLVERQRIYDDSVSFSDRKPGGQSTKLETKPTSLLVGQRTNYDHSISLSDKRPSEQSVTLEAEPTFPSSVRQQRVYDKSISLRDRKPSEKSVNLETEPTPSSSVNQQRIYDRFISFNDRRPTRILETPSVASPTSSVEDQREEFEDKSIRIRRKPSRRTTASSVTSEESTTATTSTIGKQQKLRLLIRSDQKKPTKKHKHTELVKPTFSDRIEETKSTAGLCGKVELNDGEYETTLGNKIKREDGGGAEKVAVKCVENSKGGDTTRTSIREKAVESLQLASANGGYDKTNSSADDGDEDKKTLSQQVADGKYGLIHIELFSAKPTRPGIINYEINPEVPKDNVNNLGGLNAEEIWLAENHLLVLSGGGLNDQNSRTKWTPIDNYQAPRRQVKIPERPKVPPPFPVQLTDDGPIEFLKDENGTEHRPPFFPPEFDPSAFPPPFPPFNASGNGFPPPFPVPPGFPPGNFTPGVYPPFPPPYPFSPGVQNDSRPLLPPRLPPKLPFLPPPGAGNGTDFDEDDPALYYPPPYDFYFPKDNHSIVPPGPLVPGIVLPPPPDFFAPLNEKPKNKTKTKTKLRPRPNGTYLPPPPPRKVPHVFRTTVSTTTSTIATTTTPKPVEHNEVTKPEYYFLQTTSPKPISDDITNEITQTTVSNPKYSLPIENNDWMPIPAPVPSYITGPKKPVKAGIVYTYAHTTPPGIKPLFDGYTYEKPKIPFKTDLELFYKPQSSKYDEHQGFSPSNFSNQINNELNLVYPVGSDPQRDPSYISSTGSPSPLYDSLQFKHNFKDYFGDNSDFKGSKGFLQSTTDVPYKSFSTTSRPYGKPKALEATYYFYEEPKDSSGEYPNIKNTHTKTTRKPHQASYPSPADGFHSTTPRPIFDHSLTDFKSVTSTTTPAPEKYYYVADLSDPEKLNYDGEKFKSNIFGETPKKPPKSETGSRPIVEFSYIAPSYYSDPHSGHISDQFNSRPFYDKPKYATTSKPNKLVYFNTIRSTQSPLDDYFSTTKPPKYFRNVTQLATTQQTPWYGLTKQQLATDNPYYAFFTHQDDGLIDDITKTYFTIFGQKIKATPSSDIDAPRRPTRPHSLKPGGPTPPILLNGAVYSSPKPNYIDLPHQQVSNRPEHTTPDYETSSEDSGEDYANRYTTTRPPQIAFPTYSAAHQNVQFTTPKPFYHGGFGSSNKLVPVKYSTPQPTVDSSNHHFNQRPIKIRPPVLYNDELVNYKRPLPPINPDAEFIAPRPFRNNKFKGRPRLPSGTSQIISYRLPGNGGGHFYFLTPQEVRNFDSIEPLAGDGESEDKNYYKRDVYRRPKIERDVKETKSQETENKR